MNFSHKSAYVSEDQKYRYWLARRWAAAGSMPYILWVLLNPSTADAYNDDATVRKAAGFTDRWGYKVMMFVNLYAWRATNPRQLKRVADPIGVENDHWIQTYASAAAKVVCAWGQDPSADNIRARTVLALLNTQRSLLYCLGTNRTGHPCHPLMLSYHTPLVTYGGLVNESGRRACEGRTV